MSDQDLQRNLISRVNVGDLLVRSAARAPDQLAIVDGDRRLSYRAFNEWVNRTAHGLAALGYERGDALGLMSTNNAEFLVTYFACAKLGLICVPINLFWRHNELAYVLRHAAVKGVVVEAALIDQLRPALADAPDVKDIVVIGASDETEVEVVASRSPSARCSAVVSDDEPETLRRGSRPALIPLHQRHHFGAQGRRQQSSGDLSGIPGRRARHAHDGRGPRHRADAAVPYRAAQRDRDAGDSGRRVDLHPARVSTRTRLLDLIESERLTLTFALPMMYRAMLEHLGQRSRDVSSLRLAIYAMAPMPTHELRKAIETFGCEFSLMFGQTEMNPLAVYFRPEHQLSHPGAVGTPSPNVQVAIMDESGRFLPQGQSGEIVYRSPQVMSGYLHDPAATDAAFAHGWFHSGDCGHFDADGILWFEDRFKDVIKTGGENVASIEVEKALYAADPGVQEAAVVGSAPRTLGRSGHRGRDR